MEDIIHFKPGAQMTFTTVVSDRARLLEALQQSSQDRFCIDLSSVSQCDSAGLALLIEAKRLCQQANKAFQMVGASERTQSLAEFCGVRNIIY